MGEKVGGLGLGRRTLVVVGIAGLLAACGGSNGAEPAATTSSVTATGSPTQATAAPASVDVTEEFWFGGFHVSLGTATFDPAADTGSTVAIDATFENVGSAPATFDGTPSLSSGGAFYEPSLSQELPNVPGQATGAGRFVFDVDPAFTFEDAVLTIGLADHDQAVIPLGGTGEVVTLEPISLDVHGKTKAGAIGIDLLNGELRADVPERHEQIEAGHRALTLAFDVTNSGSYEGGFAFAFGNNLALTLPDGTTIAPDDGPIELLKLGSTLPDQRVRFTVPDPADGSYKLVLIDDTRDRRSTVTFRIG